MDWLPPVWFWGSCPFPRLVAGEHQQARSWWWRRWKQRWSQRLAKRSSSLFWGASQMALLVKSPPVHAGDRWGFDLWLGKILQRRKRQPTAVFLPGKSPTVHEVTKSWTRLNQLRTAQHKLLYIREGAPSHWVYEMNACFLLCFALAMKSREETLCKLLLDDGLLNLTGSLLGENPHGPLHNCGVEMLNPVATESQGELRSWYSKSTHIRISFIHVRFKKCVKNHPENVPIT